MVQHRCRKCPRVQRQASDGKFVLMHEGDETPARKDTRTVGGNATAATRSGRRRAGLSRSGLVGKCQSPPLKILFLRRATLHAFLLSTCTVPHGPLTPPRCAAASTSSTPFALRCAAPLLPIPAQAPTALPRGRFPRKALVLPRAAPFPPFRNSSRRRVPWRMHLQARGQRRARGSGVPWIRPWDLGLLGRRRRLKLRKLGGNRRMTLLLGRVPRRRRLLARRPRRWPPSCQT